METLFIKQDELFFLFYFSSQYSSSVSDAGV